MGPAVKHPVLAARYPGPDHRHWHEHESKDRFESHQYRPLPRHEQAVTYSVGSGHPSHHAIGREIAAIDLVHALLVDATPGRASGQKSTGSQAFECEEVSE